MTETEGARFAPWLVLLSQHMPRDGGSCSCGNPLYVGHLPRLLADRADRLREDRREARAGATCSKCGHSVWDHMTHIRAGGCERCDCERTTYDALSKAPQIDTEEHTA
jgi:hypothetical protein